jgi:hypothetical protein
MTNSGRNPGNTYDQGEVIELLSAIGRFNYFSHFNDALRMEPTK